MSHFSPTSPDISALMYAHDAEKTLRRAVESIQNQPAKNVEIVVVDDGSTDGTPRMLDVMSERDIRVVVIHEQGVGRARCLGRALEAAHGSYLMVMDADGWLERDTLSAMLDRVENDGLELLVGGFALELVMAGHSVELLAESQACDFASQADFRSNAWQLFASGQLGPASAKLFSRQAAEDFGAQFGDDKYSDHLFVQSFLRDVERVGVMGGVQYRVEREVRAEDFDISADAPIAALDREYEAAQELLCHWGLAGDTPSSQMLQSRYVELLALCAEAAFGSVFKLSSTERNAAVAKMVSTKRAQLAAVGAQPRNGAARAFAGSIRAGNVPMACAQARLWSLLHRGVPTNLMPDIYL